MRNPGDPPIRFNGGFLDFPFPATESRCVWSYDEAIYTTCCGEAFSFNDGDVFKNNFRYCPYCGKLIQVNTEDTDA